MRLGLSQACYRWVFYAHLRRDTPAYAQSAERYPYFSSIPIAIDEAEAPTWLIQRCADLQLDYLHLVTTLMGDAARADTLRRFGADRGVTLIGGASANWVATDATWRADLERYTRDIRTCAAAGARLLCTTHGAPTAHNHFTKHPPIAQQIEIMIGNFRQVAAIAASEGVVIAFENHQDYRVSEIAQVIAGVASPALRANFDTGNPVAVIEDPVEAARAIAPVTAMVHLKDFRIQPSTTIGEPRILWAPIGRGQVELESILSILRAGTPSADLLPICLEVAPPPDDDPDLWVRESLGHVRRELGQYFAD